MVVIMGRGTKKVEKHCSRSIIIDFCYSAEILTCAKVGEKATFVDRIICIEAKGDETAARCHSRWD